ncbi:MAG: chromate transporter [Dysgonamonadaceae bacterium]|jgi:chromate transporter|nr:chromate transporter [Dysgonamonadaceae bacterium]
MIYLQLFCTYFKIGLFCFGGGYAMISLIQDEVVDNHAWLTNAEFTDIIAISQMTPGPIGINSATYIGYAVSGNAFGSAIATIAVCLPSFIILLLIAKAYKKFQSNEYVQYALLGLRPATVGLIASAALLLMNPENFIDYKSLVLFGAAFALTKYAKVHPILMIILAGISGLFLY